MKKQGLHCLAFFLLVQATAGLLLAIPSFSRKYALSCKVCHEPFPRLTDYGREFLNNGFIFRDKEAPRAVVDTGDTLLSLLRELPVALRIDGFAAFNNSNTNRLDFAAPTTLRLLSGGEIARNVSYYLSFFMTDLGRVVGLREATVRLRNLFGTGLNLGLGQFQVTGPVFDRELRLTLEDYEIYRSRPGLSRVDLAYDRGLFLNYRMAGGTDLTLEVLNGMGLNEAGDKANYDFDKFKNFMLRVSQNLGDKMRVGAFGYLGWEKQFNNRNDVWMLAGDATIGSPPFVLSGQYVERRDNNPYFAYAVVPADTPAVVTRGAFAELAVLPGGDDSRWYAAGLFNWVSSDDPALKYLSFTAHGGYLLWRNVRLTVEGTYFVDSPFGKYPRLAAGLITGF